MIIISNITTANANTMIIMTTKTSTTTGTMTTKICSKVIFDKMDFFFFLAIERHIKPNERVHDVNKKAVTSLFELRRDVIAQRWLRCWESAFSPPFYFYFLFFFSEK